MKNPLHVLLSICITFSVALWTTTAQAGFWGKIVSGITGSDEAGDAVDGTIDAGNEAAQTAAENVSNRAGDMAEGAQAAADSLMPSGKNAPDSSTQSEDVVGQTNDLFNQSLEFVIEESSEDIDDLITSGNKMKNDAESGLQETAEEFGETGAAMADNLQTRTQKAAEELEEAGVHMQEGLETAQENIAEGTHELAEDLQAAGNEAMENLNEQSRNGQKKFIQTVETASTVAETANGMRDEIRNNMGGESAKENKKSGTTDSSRKIQNKAKDITSKPPERQAAPKKTFEPQRNTEPRAAKTPDRIKTNTQKK